MKKFQTYTAFLALSAMHVYGIMLYTIREFSGFLHGRHGRF